MLNATTRQDARRLRPAARARRAPARWRPLPHPRAAEASYAEAVVGLLDKAWARIIAALAPVLAEAEKDEREDAAHLDAKPKKRRASVTFEVVVEDLPERVEAPFSAGSVAPVAAQVAKSTDATHLRNLRRQFAEAVGVQVLKSEPELAPAVRDFTKKNVELIGSLKGEVLERLKKELGAALDSGARPPELEKLLREQYGVARRKAEFIARDQVGKLHASLTEERHRKLGITRYRWRTVRDNRVRRRHVKREGVVFEYAKPPHDDKTDGHAGHPPRCRCYQEPILDDVLPISETIRREQETVDPAPPEAPRPSRGLVPVAKAEKLLEQVRRAAKVSPAKATAARARPKPAAPPQAQPLVDLTTGWKPTRVYKVPLEWLDDVPAMVWQEGRAASIRNAYTEGKAKELPPIRIVTENKVTGARELADGNHRLAVARERGEKFVAVRFSDKAAAALIARPRNPGAPWFIRENPEKFPHLVTSSGTPKKPR